MATKEKGQTLTAPNPNLPQGRGNPPTKTDSVTKELRVSMIAEMLLQGARRSQVNAYLAKTETWHPDHPSPDPEKVSQRTIDRYMTLARDKIEASADKRRNYLLGKSLEQLDDLYYKSLKIQDYKTCAKIIMDRADLTGLRRIEAISRKQEVKMDFTKYSKDDLIAVMREARGKRDAEPDEEERVSAAFEETEFDEVMPD